MGEAADDLYDALEKLAEKESECIHGCVGNCEHLDPMLGDETDG